MRVAKVCCRKNRAARMDSPHHRSPHERLLAESGLMKSRNFEFLRSLQPELATYGGFAEHHARLDPTSTGTRLRSFAEVMVREIYRVRRFPRPLETNLNDLLLQPVFEQAIPRVVKDKLHLLRKHGNHAAHGGELSTEIALRLLNVAFELGSYFYVAILGRPQSDLPAYQAPSDVPTDGSKGQLQREKKALLQQLTDQEARMKEALAAAEAERIARERLAEQLERTAAELEALRATDVAYTTALGLSEEDTRKQVIDADLLLAGWNVADRAQVGIEVEVEGQPTRTGKGRADYVLWGADGMPLAVIEAKKSSRDADEGRKQAQLYADALQAKWAVRPVIYCTNGYEIWLWDDARNETPRQVFGFYGKDSLEQLHFKRRFAQPIASVAPNSEIAGRDYQLEAIKRVAEAFDRNVRRALIVQATGTGKTRVAVSLTDVLMRANVVKRVLFLCDRRELRKQAKNAFSQFLPKSNPVVLTASNADVTGPQVYIATYQTMMELYERFDVGFFDVIVADESHRSIYNRFRDLFRYFDALQVGLTATPVKFIERNTYQLFGCADQDPTMHYSLAEAVAEKVLVPMRVKVFQTEFQQRGMRYADMTDAQRAQLEQQLADADAIDYDSADLDRIVYNKDTNRLILRNLMENGLRVKDGTQIGKTIVFARSRDHALLLKRLFDEMYPVYGGGFCEAIDHKNPRAEQLIDEFKGDGTRKDLVIAISVDMLDTGVDVPDVVNLVFAKPVKSYVKFWQMIGRGTRLCPNLFGPGIDKKEFLIFDHWGNFEYFDEQYEEPNPAPERSLQHRVFEARLDLALAASHALAQRDVERTVDLLLADLRALVETRSIAVKEQRRLIDQLSDREALLHLAAATVERLRHEVAPLMKWRSIAGHEAAWRFDLLVTRLQTARLLGVGDAADLEGEVRNQVESVRMNLSQVKAKAGVIAKVRDSSFWSGATTTELEELRTELRGIMQFRQMPPNPVSYGPLRVDVAERPEHAQLHDYHVRESGLDLVAYRHRVSEALNELVPDSPTLQKIRSAEPVDDRDVEELCALVLAQNPQLDLKRLHVLYPETAGKLASAIRRVIGVDAGSVEQTFQTFLQAHPNLSAAQMSFIRLLKRYILEHGGIEREKPYDEPFTRIHVDGLDGVFPDSADASSVLALIERFTVERTSSRPEPLH